MEEPSWEIWMRTHNEKGEQIHLRLMYGLTETDAFNFLMRLDRSLMSSGVKIWAHDSSGEPHRVDERSPPTTFPSWAEKRGAWLAHRNRCE